MNVGFSVERREVAGEGVDVLKPRYLNSGYLVRGAFPSRALPILAIALVILANVMVFLVVPNEEIMGAAQRIFYFHVGAAFSSYGFIFALLLSSVIYLTSRSALWDAVAESAASVGLLLCSVVLATGMIWGHSAWNVWWRWEPRLVSFLVLWLMLFSYSMLRGFTERNPKQGSFAAVLGILTAVNVPIVVFSIKVLNQADQLHPEVIGRQGGLGDPSFVWALLVAIAAMLALSLWVFVVRLGQVLLEQELSYQEERMQDIEEDS